MKYKWVKYWQIALISLIGGMVGGIFVVVAGVKAWISFGGNIIGVLLAGFISFLVARMQLNVDEKRRQKEELSNLNADIARFKEEEDVIASCVGKPSPEAASINFNEFMKCRRILIESKARCVSILEEPEKKALEDIFTKSRQQANNYLQAFFIKSDTGEVAKGNIGQNKWTNNINADCKIVTDFIDEFNKK